MKTRASALFCDFGESQGSRALQVNVLGEAEGGQGLERLSREDVCLCPLLEKLQQIGHWRSSTIGASSSATLRLSRYAVSCADATYQLLSVKAEQRHTNPVSQLSAHVDTL